uniref:Uncharacterized protein n=1 Tax=Lepeophtheirus salmonis TaxID=72036 RepID=A0A0K2UV66_LEPSM
MTAVLVGPLLVNFWVVLISLIWKVSDDYMCCRKKYQQRSCLLFKRRKTEGFHYQLSFIWY